MSKLKKALQKAQEKREVSHQYFPEQSKPSVLKKDAQQKEKSEENITKEKESVKIEYTKTKVHLIDPAILKKNKVVSLFHDHEMTDHINLLKAQLISKLKSIGGNSILITSSNPGEGKTFVSINLAISIAKELNKTVLLVDADLKNPSIHHYDFASDFLGIEINRGLADYLLGQAELPELLINPGIEKLTILPAGRALPNSSELLGSPRMEKLVAEIKDRYKKDRIVIFDCSSILASPDPLVFSHLVDGILVVVEAEKTTPVQLKRALELLADKPVIGTVMNKNMERR
jgi:protein-tyrosine kinase